MKKCNLIYLPLLGLLLTSFLDSPKDTALEFLESLSTEQQKKVMLEFEDQRRQDWHFFPWTMFEREGLGVFDLDQPQKKLLFDHLKAHLSQSGFDRVRHTMSLEKVLQEMGGDPTYRDPEKYYIAFYGNPGKDKIWGWGFEGHHLSLNFTIVDGKVSYTPKFFGANPAEITTGSRRGERSFAREIDHAFTLLESLTTSQKEKVIIAGQTFGDIITMVEKKVEPLTPKGIPFSQLNNDQQSKLWALIGSYLADMPEPIALVRKQNLLKEEGEIYFAWAGATEQGKPYYFRVQGKTFLIEFDNTQNSGNHIHTVWRDFNGDFGRDLIKEHYALQH